MTTAQHTPDAFPHWDVDTLNDLNRGIALVNQQYLAPDCDFRAWVQVLVRAQMRQDELRERVANQCAAWFRVTS